MSSVRSTAGIGIVGVLTPEDPGAPDDDAKEGRVRFNMRSFFAKGLHAASGQCNVKAYNRQLLSPMEAGKAKPSVVVSHHLPLDKAPDGYEHFDARTSGWTKVVLKRRPAFGPPP